MAVLVPPRDTKWAKKLVDYHVDSLAEEAFEIAEHADLIVDIIQNDETGEWLWSIDNNIRPGFWLDSFKTKREAISLCDAMGWEIGKIVEATWKK